MQVLCIDPFEFYDLINRGIPPQTISQMTLEEIEQLRPVDLEDMRYVSNLECENCPNKNYCGEYKRQ